MAFNGSTCKLWHSAIFFLLAPAGPGGPPLDSYSPYAVLYHRWCHSAMSTSVPVSVSPLDYELFEVGDWLIHLCNLQFPAKTCLRVGRPQFFLLPYLCLCHSSLGIFSPYCIAFFYCQTSPIWFISDVTSKKFSLKWHSPPLKFQSISVWCLCRHFDFVVTSVIQYLLFTQDMLPISLMAIFYSS